MRDKDKGFIEIFALVITSLFMVLSIQMVQEAILHRKVGNAYVQNIQEDYRLEGVLLEAKLVREKKGFIDPTEKISSIYLPDYKYYFGNDRIYISKGVSNLLTVTYIIYNGKVVITGVKSQSNSIYMRE